MSEIEGLVKRIGNKGLERTKLQASPEELRQLDFDDAKIRGSMGIPPEAVLETHIDLQTGKRTLLSINGVPLAEWLKQHPPK